MRLVGTNGTSACSGIGIQARNSADVDLVLLQPLQVDAGKSQAPFPVGIYAAPFTSEADRIALQMAVQHSDRDHQWQSIDLSRILHLTALGL